MHTIKDARIKKTLDRLHTEAAAQRLTLVKGLVKGLFRKLKPEDMQDAYIPISRQQGEFLYDLLLREEATHIVEFGTSFGISTIYLAAAAKQTNGKVITTEILPNKCQVARHNFREAGLEKWIEIREGDAMETLTGINDEIDFLLLDGWNDLYLPLLKILPLKMGALIWADNAALPSAKPYIQYLRSKPDQYRSQRLKDDKGGAELTTRIG